MTRFDRNQRTSALCTLLLAVCVSGVATAASADKDPLQVVPADSLFCVRINNVDRALSQMDQFLTGIAPLSTSMLVRAQMGQLLGGMEAQGVDLSGSAAVFGPLPGGEAPDPSRIGVLVPISDYQKFVQGNPNVTAPDASGVSAIGPEGGQEMAAVQVGDFALVSAIGNRQALGEVKKWITAGGTTGLAKRLSKDTLRQAGDTRVWAYVNIQTVSKMFGPMIEQKLKEAKQEIQKAQSESTDEIPFNPANFLDMYISMLNSLMQETQFVSLSLNPSASVVDLGFTLAAVPDTDMAKLLSPKKDPDQELQYLGYLKNGAVMNFAASSSPEFNKTFAEGYLELVGTMLGEMLSPEDLAQLKEMLSQWVDVFGGAAAWSLSIDPAGKPPFAVQYAVTIKDKEKLYQVFERMEEMMGDGAIGRFYEKMGLGIKFDSQRNVETYKGVSIDAMTISMDPGDMSQDSMEAAMIQSLYGGQWNLRLAVVDQLLLYTLSAEPEKAIHELIDQAKAGGPKQVPSEVQAAMELIPNARKAAFFGTYNYLRLFQMITTMMPMPLPKTAMPSQSNMAVAGNAGDGKVTVQVALPKQHVQEIMMAFMQMQQQMQQQRQEQDN